MLRSSPLLVGLLVFIVPMDAKLQSGAATYRLVDAFPGVTFTRALFAAQPPDGTPRMFVVEQDGRVRIVDYPAPAPPAVAAERTFLDVSGAVSRVGNEEGLLGLAFHPDFATNGKFYVRYTAKYANASDRHNVLSEMRVSAADPDRADPSSERVILSTPQPFSNHNGGWIAFGLDGKLYMSVGDGGSGGDPFGNGQSLATHHGKILRIDVDGAAPYSVPADNPFVSRAGALPEIWAYGLRNPWRCSFDSATGDLWAGDVGQDTYEEVDRIVAGGNYGWNRKEAFADFAPVATPPADPLTDPLAAYDHGAGQSVIGGYVYRGANVPSLAGAYVYADFVSGAMWALRKNAGVVGPPQTKDDVTVEQILSTSESIASFGEDRNGELVVCSFNGRVLSLEGDAAPPPGGPFPAKLSETGLFADLPNLVPADGALPYAVRTPLWSDGADKSRFVLLPSGAPMTYAAEDAFGLPPGAYVVKTFSVRGRRLETRVIERTDSGFEASTYRWQDDLADASLVTQRESVAVLGRRGFQTWTFPSPADCRKCHTDAAGFLLGVTSRQVMPARGGGDLVAKWAARGVLTGTVPPRRERPVSLPVKGAGRVEARVRSYLAANCAACHRPGAPLDGGALDLRAATPLDATGLVGGAPQHGDLGIAGAEIVAPGDPSKSVLWQRMRLRGPTQMPSLATALPDAAAVKLVAAWIRRLR
jgi:uncharacterized repeat protein (TIGR03806 family)